MKRTETCGIGLENRYALSDRRRRIEGLAHLSRMRDNVSCGRVAQLDRASAFEAEGYWFEPSRAHHLPLGVPPLPAMQSEPAF